MLLLFCRLVAALATAQSLPQDGGQAVHIYVTSDATHFVGGVPAGPGATPRAPLPRLGPPDLPTFEVTCRSPDCPDAVSLLLRSVTAPPKPGLFSPDFAQVLAWLQSATPDELRGSLDTPSERYLFDRLRSMKPTWNAFEAARKDPSYVSALLRDYYKGVSDHDSPHVRAILHLPADRTIVLSSTAEHPFMIPWRIEENRSDQLSYEPDIGRALAALAPPHFTEEQRLSGARLRSDLLSLLLYRVEHDQTLHPK